ncbi:hypothetical protein Q31b_27970 [Novipirellula aureliae]|uniref:Uncharacterized protein n=1 Tax=Novipirellula aureliae TaxID=2527966 RepID=A0A5C6DVF0_9BACT|nr:hypothetical protein Q31b_27970 [Novipirellula aureliae]
MRLFSSTSNEKPVSRKRHVSERRGYIIPFNLPDFLANLLAAFRYVVNT